MNTSTLITLSILLAVMFFIIQRSEKRRRWLVAGVLLIPSITLLIRWSIYKNQLFLFFISTGIALVLNIAYWLLYGRKHPPGTSDDIHVVGMED